MALAFFQGVCVLTSDEFLSCALVMHCSFKIAVLSGFSSLHVQSFWLCVVDELFSVIRVKLESATLLLSLIHI